MTAEENASLEPSAFGSVSTHDDLVAWSRGYARSVADGDEIGVDLSLVDWAVSTRAKRRAAAVKRPRIPGTEVGKPVDWDSVAAAAESPETVRRCTVSLTWEAAAAFSRAEWTATLRHELIHVEQFQRYGTTDHGPRFERRAAELDAPVRCRRFATPKYRLRCVDCEEVVARRYRDCKLVREHERYQSSCCAAALRCERVRNQ